MKRIEKNEKIWRYNRFPDEKGTESNNRGARVEDGCRYNRFPDEKGTESGSKGAAGRFRAQLQSFPR